MHVPIISPRILRVLSLVTPQGMSCCFVELGACLTPDGAETLFDLFVADDAAAVSAAIARAKASGLLLALVSPSDGVNPITERPWHVGQIGPASELEFPPPFGVLPIPAIEDGQTALFAPAVTAVRPAWEASAYFEGYPDAACLDLAAGEDGDVFHVVVPLNPNEARGFVDSARLIRRPLVVHYSEPLPIRHQGTGRPVYMGQIERLGTRDHA